MYLCRLGLHHLMLSLVSLNELYIWIRESSGLIEEDILRCLPISAHCHCFVHFTQHPLAQCHMTRPNRCSEYHTFCHIKFFRQIIMMTSSSVRRFEIDLSISFRAKVDESYRAYQISPPTSNGRWIKHT